MANRLLLQSCSNTNPTTDQESRQQQFSSKTHSEAHHRRQLSWNTVKLNDLSNAALICFQGFAINQQGSLESGETRSCKYPYPGWYNHRFYISESCYSQHWHSLDSTWGHKALRHIQAQCGPSPERATEQPPPLDTVTVLKHCASPVFPSHSYCATQLHSLLKNPHTTEQRASSFSC